MQLTYKDKQRIVTEIRAIAFDVLASEEISTKQTALSEMIERIESAFFPVEPAKMKSVYASCGTPTNAGMDMRKELCKNNISPMSAKDLHEKLLGDLNLERKDDVSDGADMMKRFIADLKELGVNVSVNVIDLL